eukprot:7333550-Pyramimonas_sp.AAC.1
MCIRDRVYNNNGSRLILPHHVLKNRVLAWDSLAIYHRIAAPVGYFLTVYCRIASSLGTSSQLTTETLRLTFLHN